MEVTSRTLVSGLGLNPIGLPSLIALQLLGDRLKVKTELLGDEVTDLVVLTGTSEGLGVDTPSEKSDIRGGVSTGGPVDSESAAESLGQELGELGGGRLEGNSLRQLLLGGLSNSVLGENLRLEVSLLVGSSVGGPLLGERSGGGLGSSEERGVVPVSGRSRDLLSDGQSSALVVGGGDEGCGRVGVLIDPLTHGEHGLVVGEDVVEVSNGVVGVSCVVNTGSLNHDEESLLGILGGTVKVVKTLDGHLLQGGLDGGVTVGLVGHVVVGEESKVGELELGVEGGTVLEGGVSEVTGDGKSIDTILTARSLSGVGGEEAASSSEHDIDGSSERVGVSNLLEGNLGLEVTVVDMRGEGSGGGVGDTGGNNESSLESLKVSGLKDGSTGLVVIINSDGSVVGLDSARVGGGRGSGVGDVGVGGLGADHSDHHLVDGEDSSGVVLPVHVVTGHGLRGGSESIRNNLNSIRINSWR